MSIMNDLNAYASELFAKEEISKDYYKKPENEYEKMNKLVMDALKNFYGDEKAVILYDDWINAFFDYHHSMRISDFRIGVKFVIKFSNELNEFDIKES